MWHLQGVPHCLALQIKQICGFSHSPGKVGTTPILHTVIWSPWEGILFVLGVGGLW
jgi:hypothetical protein